MDAKISRDVLEAYVRCSHKAYLLLAGRHEEPSPYAALREVRRDALRGQAPSRNTCRQCSLMRLQLAGRHWQLVKQGEAMDISTIKALTFDIFGTVVDWSSTIIREGQHLGSAKGITIDWTRFADAWRSGYQPAMHQIRTGALPWQNIDMLHRLILDGLLAQFEISGLREPEIDDLNRVWHRLEPWPDVKSGLERLRRCFVVTPLSNGNADKLCQSTAADV
jgi:hypothetical protein